MNDSRLFGSANWIMALGVVSALIAAQWKQEAIPVIALTAILAMTVAKIRLIVLDFMHLRGSRPNLARALLIWPVFFAAISLAKMVLASIMQ
ncbi:cytochrome C oxidase subunit IV family protein [Rhizobium puerariae]|uniref:Cytochrome C oxidase subunit IV family protein n=1 Tax=Rhizobium puerariae TaxID=1585791 RepID=A0ABV6ABD0_9HYPH